MFQSIRNFFHDLFFGKDELPAYVWHNGKSFTITLPYSDDRLTQAELQMLQRIVADEIYLEGECQKLDKIDAASHPKGSYSRDAFSKSARKRGVKLKKLSALQYRLKHKIAAKG